MQTTLKAGQAEILQMPSRRMAVVHSVGDPEVVGERILGALYGAVYNLKFDLKKKGVDYEIEPPRARWTNVDAPRERWEADWGIPVPEDVDEVFQQIADVPVTVETWEYGSVGQILHVGTYEDEAEDVERLRGFIKGTGFKICGPHEEEYISRPGAKEQQTIIRYQVRRK